MQKGLLKIFGVFGMVMLSACSASTYKDKEKETANACPNIWITEDTSQITKIVDNQPLWKAKIDGYKGTCSFNKNRSELELNLNVDFTAELLKKDIERAFTVRYYVAVPVLYPDAVGKQNFYLDVVFPSGKDKVNVRKRSTNLSFPLKKEDGTKINIKDVYVGIQLDREQLAYNRKKK